MVSVLAGTDFRGLWGRQSRFSRSPGSPGSISGDATLGLPQNDSDKLSNEADYIYVTARKKSRKVSEVF